MLKKNLLDLRFPVGGLDRRYSYRQQPPYTTPGCVNVRPTDTILDRERGGSRPGISKAFQQDLGGPIRLLNDITIVSSDGIAYWADNFKGNGSLGNAWSAASWTDGLPDVSEDLSSISYGESAGAVRTLLSPFDTSDPYQIEMMIVPYQGQFAGKYQLFARMNNTTPNAILNGLVVELDMTGDDGSYDGSAVVYVAGVPTEFNFTPGTMDTAKPGVLRLIVDGNDIDVYWQDELVLSQNSIGSPAGTRFGFGMEATEAGGICLVDMFRIQYYTGDLESYKQMVVASAEGALFREIGFLGQLEELTSDVNLADDRNLQCVAWNQKLYIADYGDLKVGGVGAIDVTGLELTDGDVTDWTTYDIDTDNDVVVLTNATGSVVEGSYKIASVVTGKVTLAATCGSTGTASYRIERAPKVYDPQTDTLEIWMADADKGSVPVGCPLICRYRDAIVLAGSINAPHLWYIGRVGDPYDWDFLAEDDAGAVFGEDSDAGSIGQPIIGMAPYSDDYLLFGCTTSLWVMRGHPRFGGLIDNVDYTVGFIGPESWCWGPSGEIIFLSRDGLYLLPPGASGKPDSISRERMPRELQGVDSNLYEASLVYDVQARGVHIYLTPIEPQGRLHMWFDWDVKSFWPVKLADGHEPFVTLQYQAIAQDDAAVLLGCRDGYIRRYSNLSESDDGTEIESYVDYGPIRMGESDYEKGILSELIGVVAKNSGPVSWALRVSETQEEAMVAENFETGEWSEASGRAGLNFKTRVRARGGAMVLRLSNGETNRSWGVERITGVAMGVGPQRLG